MSTHGVISSDSHIIEPPDLWAGRMESKYRDRAPRIIREEGVDWWYCDDMQLVSVFQGSQPEIRFEEPEKLIWKDTMENVRPGGYIPEEHVRDMDIDGVDLSILYPSAGLVLYLLPDNDLLTAVFSAYNSWLAEFCSAAPNRLKGIAMLNSDDVPSCVVELQRCAKLGLAGGMITSYPPPGMTYDLPQYEPLWAAASDLQMPLGLHLATNRPGNNNEFTGDFDAVSPSLLCNADLWVRMSLSDMIYSGVFERHPKLRVGSIEQELSWVPHFLERLDYTYTQRVPRKSMPRFKEDMLPSDYFHRNIFLSFQEDGLGIKLRDIIGVDNLLWGSDYPHQESTFPRSREILDRILSECSFEEKAKISAGNASRIYHLS